MGAERVDYYSDEEFEQALARESQQMQAQESQPQEQYPNVVPCYKCGGQMYEEGSRPEDNICPICTQQT